jgi:hypothetical protein
MRPRFVTAARRSTAIVLDEGKCCVAVGPLIRGQVWGQAQKINSVQLGVRFTPRKLSKLLHRRDVLPG